MSETKNPNVGASLDDYQLTDRYLRTTGRVFLTGTQALVKLMLMQRQSDDEQGINSAGFVSGYRGSPLGAVDQEMWRARDQLEKHNIRFLPAINEDLAATAVLGTQQVESEVSRTVDGVCSLWYGKGPGVDRAGDALKHGNAYGSSAHGGVLVVAGDDHGSASSSMSHQSDVAFMAWYMPILNPSSISEYIEFGLYGYALSRYSGTWVGFKAISETVEGAASVDLPQLPNFSIPEDFEHPQGGLNYRWPDLPGMQIETRMKAKKQAVRAFARANPIDRTIFNHAEANFGIITTGKAFLDVMEALSLLGIDKQRAADIGIDVYKVGLVWPLEHEGAISFMTGKQEILVVEEKRGIIESQLKEYLYDRAALKPRLILGKHDENGDELISWVDELSPSTLAPILARRISKLLPQSQFDAHLRELATADENRIFSLESSDKTATRVPYFCSGCPHNSSTKVPDGSRALAGIGCHFMAAWMNRDTSDLIQMGGEGVNWASKSLFVNEQHIFQNMGDGTYYHSGYMAIRQAIAASTNITYKILFNDAVAMTGGQPIDGKLTVAGMASQLKAEGVGKIVIVSDQPQKLRNTVGIPPETEIHHRDQLDQVQRQLREMSGVTALIYEQGCAAEKRRKRKRGQYPDPAKRLFINQQVCEGCGDCSTQSNCLSIVPVETEFGRKRKVDQWSCNKDYSCANGFCPSFVTIEGGELRRPDLDTDDLNKLCENLPEPKPKPIDRSYDLLVCGVGGTGVVTIGALITMAAHLEGKGASVLDFMGFAQKGGSVLSYVRLARSPEQLNQVRIDRGSAQVALLCDLIVGTDKRALACLRTNTTHVIANRHIKPTADFIGNRDVDFHAQQRLHLLQSICGHERLTAIDTDTLVEGLLGNPVYANLMLLGYAWQQGHIPLSRQALERAIELNGVEIDNNKLAFNLGRAACVRESEVVRKIRGQPAADISAAPVTESSEILVNRLSNLLLKYQNAAYAGEYRQFITDFRNRLDPAIKTENLIRTVARNLFKLMAYKDEYEVARLYTAKEFSQQLQQQFSGKFKLQFHMAPPLLPLGKDSQGRPKKIKLGSYVIGLFHILARLKFLRGTVFDPFGYSRERRLERRLIGEYKSRMLELASDLVEHQMESAITIAAIPENIRGFGPVKLESIRQAEVQLTSLMQKPNDPVSICDPCSLASKTGD